ncbi:hypothetical protein GCM10009737_06580 [Nocardioides lentus]|uniref:Uncharacterized protein n=1 Tax=Nocardioides lentus TaxID=338077 RepID=A0ABN2P279_9ACTN
MDSLLVDMNRIKPLPTVAREVRADLANLAFLGVVVAGLWVFEVSLAPVLVVGAVVVVLLAARLAWRVAQGDVEGPTAAPAPRR